MKLLVIGETGQLAHCLAERSAEFPNLMMTVVGRPGVDLEQPGSAAALIDRAGPDAIINAAAYTAVDQAEDEPNRAFQINGEAPKEIARAASRTGAALIHLSTDYVFDGQSVEPYQEGDSVNPRNVYGRSKLAGESAVRDELDRHLIIRTSWVYSPFGKNFVKTMMALADDRDTIRVVDDQRGCPTSAVDLAEALLRLCQAGLHTFGTFHLAGDGSTSWCGLARQVMEERERLGLRAARVEPINSAEFPTPARRPANSVLNCGAFAKTFGFRLRPWQQSLRPVVERLARAHAI